MCACMCLCICMLSQRHIEAVCVCGHMYAYVCMCAHMYLYVWICEHLYLRIHVCICAQMCLQGTPLGVILQRVVSYFIGPELHLAGWASQHHGYSCHCLPPLHPWDCKHLPPCLAFYIGFGA